MEVPFQFTHPEWLLVLPLGAGWVIWLGWKTEVLISPWRRWVVLGLRLGIVVLLIGAIAGLQWLRPQEGMNVFFVLDRSDSVPEAHKESALDYVYEAARQKREVDRAGVIVFGMDAGIEFSPNSVVKRQKLEAVVSAERTDIAGAVRLGTAAFPEAGQKRVVLLSDGNENIGDGFGAALAASSLGVSIDVVPLGAARGGDVSMQKLTVPSNVKKGQTFEVKLFAQADQAQPATVRLYRNEQYLGEQKVELAAGKNLFTFPQTLDESGFYTYHVALEAVRDQIAQNNRATSYTSVRGDPRVLIVSAEPAADGALAEALRSVKMEVKVADIAGFPGTLAEMQTYDSIFLSNVAAGDLGRDLMKLLESAVRDFGVGLVCIGGDQAYAAGGYRGTPLETVLPVEMELSSKKVLPSGALVLVMHGMEFNNGNQVARNIALAALDGLGPQDEMGVILWDGFERWLFPLGKAGDKKEMARQISGMNQGDLPSFQGVMSKAHEGLKKSTANLKHIIVFSDGDPGAPTPELMNSIVSDKITVSSVLIAGHFGPETMMEIARQGGGQFYDVRSAEQLPQIFIKEAAVILKSAIFENPFKPQLVASSELVRGMGGGEFPTLLGYVATTAKARAETPLLSESGDPILAHWQYGLGRAVAFTSDAKAKWAREWLSWGRYRQFWSQAAQWSLRRLDTENFSTEVAIEKGEGHLSVEALDAQGNFRNFLNLQAIVVNPKGERETVRLEQTGSGHYETTFGTREVGAYMIHLMNLEGGEVRGSQVLGASVNYSPEFSASEPNLNLLRKMAEVSRGRVLEIDGLGQNPFLHDRVRTFQQVDLWEWLLRAAILLFPVDVGLRRIQIDREEWARTMAKVRGWLVFWRPVNKVTRTDESLAALLARRDEVRAQTRLATEVNPELFRPERAGDVQEFVAKGAEQAPPALVASEPAVPQAPGETSVTSRLLEAKRRAQRRK